MLNIKDSDDLISRLSKIYINDGYSYINTIYVSDNIPVTLSCKIHGDFQETPYNLITKQIGCPLCYNNHSNGELEVKKILDEYGIKYETEKSMPFLKYKKDLKFDFWLPDMNIAIEYQGAQHYKPIDFFGGKKAFQEQKIRDNIKREFCDFYKYQLIEIGFFEDPMDKLEPVFEEYFNNLY